MLISEWNKFIPIYHIDMLISEWNKFVPIYYANVQICLLYSGINLFLCII